MNKLAFLALLLALIFSASAASWSGSVKTDSGSWDIKRQSSNSSFFYEQSVQGQISAVDYRGRSLSPYHSFYENVNFNDVRVKERTAAQQGAYSSEEMLSIKSNINNSVNATICKPAGSDVYTIEFQEHWPVNLSYSKSINYTGKGINNREFFGNNYDYAGANFLYNHEFSKERHLNATLKRMNSTVLATEEAILKAELEATRDTQYSLKSHSTGIATLKYRQLDERNEILNEADERFVGIYDINSNIQMKSRFDKIQKEEDWLLCCSGGYLNLTTVEQEGLKSARGIFDCTCHEISQNTQL